MSLVSQVLTSLQDSRPGSWQSKVEKQRQSFDLANKKQITPLKQLKVQLQGSWKSPSARFLSLITKVKQLFNSLKYNNKTDKVNNSRARKTGKRDPNLNSFRPVRESTFRLLPQLDNTLGSSGERAGWLEALPVLASDPSSVPSTHTGWLTSASISSSWGPDALSWLSQAPAGIKTNTQQTRKQTPTGQVLLTGNLSLSSLLLPMWKTYRIAFSSFKIKALFYYLYQGKGRWEKSSYVGHFSAFLGFIRLYLCCKIPSSWIYVYFKMAKVGCLENLFGPIFPSSLYVLNSLDNCLTSGCMETACLFPEKYQLNCQRSVSSVISLGPRCQRPLKEWPEGWIRKGSARAPALSGHTLASVWAFCFAPKC